MPSARALHYNTSAQGALATLKTAKTAYGKPLTMHPLHTSNSKAGAPMER